MMTLVRRIALALFALVAAAGAAAAQLAVYPSSPMAGQDFVIAVTTSCGGGAVVRVDTSTITLDFGQETLAPCPPPSPVPTPVVLPVNVSVPGTYALVTSVRNLSGQTVTATVGQVVVRSKVASQPPAFSLTGLWWVPSQPGWALSITQGDTGQLFLVWYTYSPAAASQTVAQATWFFTSGGQWVDAFKFSGILNAAAGSPLTRTYDPSALTASPWGLATVSVLSQDALVFSVDPGFAAGVPSNLQLTRFKF